MKIYFVRHGESEANRKKIEQGIAGPLSLLGKAQAEYAAKRFKGAPINLIISSISERAKETAEVINKQLNTEVLYSDLFIERLPPTKFIGKPLHDPEIVSAYDTILKMRQQPGSDNWRFADEENFEDFKARAEKALEYLRSLNAESVLVVTHGGFLRMLVSLMIFGKSLNYHEYVHILFTLKTSNTGVTICEYLPQTGNEKRRWRILAWNDHAHLGIRPKKLKFRSQHIPIILSQTATVTWRLFDDKQIKQGDELVLINSDTDRQFGKAQVLSVREKKLRAVEPKDLPTYEELYNKEKIIETCKLYYGDQVTPETPIKIIEFELVK